VTSDDGPPIQVQQQMLMRCTGWSHTGNMSIWSDLAYGANYDTSTPNQLAGWVGGDCNTPQAYICQMSMYFSCPPPMAESPPPPSPPSPPLPPAPPACEHALALAWLPRIQHWAILTFADP
jgi:hypothetical protein